MIWKKCELKNKVNQTEDVLGNQTGGTWQMVKSTVCRFTPWTEEQIAVEGREVTRNEQQYIIPIPFEQFPDCTHISINGGVVQQIKESIALSVRWTLIRVMTYKEKK